MTFLAPLALLGLASLGPLLWLWRLAATRQQVEVPSLAPFEHLLQRPPQRRRRLHVNALFWLQCAALVLLVAALMRPIRWSHPASTSLIVLDTSASLGARAGAGTVLEDAKRRARERLEAVQGAWFVVTTAPVAPLTQEPAADAAETREAVAHVQLGEMGGSLATAAHIGQALLGRRPDHVIVVTDEPAPAPAPGVEFATVGSAAPNVAFVGLEAQRSLCSQAPDRVVATVQNFSTEPATTRILARHKGRTVAEASLELAAHERRSVPLPIAEPLEGFIDLTLRASDDALALDNTARLPIRRAAAWPVAVQSEDPEFLRRIGAWLNACEGLAWQAAPPEQGPFVVITDDPARVPAAAAAAIVFARAGAQLRVSHWFAADHPVAAYLPPVMPVAASLAAPAGEISGEPAVWGIAGGERVPVAIASDEGGRRCVTMRLDPLATPSPTPLVLLFYNSLRWVMDHADVVHTGEPLTVPSLPAGTVIVERPDGGSDRIEHRGGAFRYDRTTRAGLYTIRAGGIVLTRAANFLDPQESNLLEQASTWRPLPEPLPGAARPRIPQPLAKAALALGLGLLLLEWWWYARRSRRG